MCSNFANKACQDNETDFAFPAAKLFATMKEIEARGGETKLALIYDSSVSDATLKAFDHVATALEDTVVCGKLNVEALVDVDFKAHFPTLPVLKVHAFPKNPMTGILLI